MVLRKIRVKLIKELTFYIDRIRKGIIEWFIPHNSRQ